jgi:hypothetical protein
MDVRLGLAPFRSLSRRLEIVASYSLHSIKSGTPGPIRQLTGGSGQWTDLARAAIFVGYHPERDGFQAAVRGKANVGALPPAMVFKIGTRPVANPKTGEVIEPTVLVDLQEDHKLRPEEVLPYPAKEREEPKRDVIVRVLEAIGADGKEHERQEAADECRELGVSHASFEREFPSQLGWLVETRREGRKTLWRLKTN